MKLTDLLGNWGGGRELRDKLQAVYLNQAVIEFDPHGMILEANNNFLMVMGYQRHEVVGNHHRMFVDPQLANSREYTQFWESLRRGETFSAEFKRVGNKGKGVWINGSYCPLLDKKGRVYKIVKFALDITAQKEAEEKNRKTADIANALKLCQANVMLADLDFNIIYMNDTVTEMMKYRERELRSALPDFSVAGLLGSSVDRFHVRPGHQRKLIGELNKPYKTHIEIAGLTFELIASPWLDQSGKRIGTLVEWLDKTDRLAKEVHERRIAEENARVRQALDSVTANVMIADGDANIIYLNNSVSGMMRRAEADIRKALPHFDAANLRGKNIDIFHKNPSHQRDLLKNLTTTYHGKAEVGGRIFTVIANPVTVDGQRIGSVVEWADRTAEVAIEKEVAAMIQAAGSGDFTRQINMDGKEGFFANLGKGLNELVGTIEVALNDIRRMLGAMARGDLTERITREYLGTFGQLKDDANTTADKLTEIIGKIRSSSGAILSAANEISQGNLDLSQRTEEQASSLEETASSMEEMTSTVKQSAENAQRANEVSQMAQRKAKEGGQVVSRAVQAMEEISSSSKKISDIIGVIDEIAFQTNLLALNAAVEAARAGEQGRGFAVVAGEVRNLAQRSAGAAKEIKDLIRDSVGKVQDGRQLVNASGETLNEIVAGVEKVSSMMQEIAQAAQEQTSGIEQVNSAIAQMDEMTQQNAALVEQASAAGASLADQANAMNSVVEFFSVGGRAEAAYLAPPARGAQPQRATPAKNKKAQKKTAVPRGQQGTDEEWEEF
jgi:methyl-accepting chemotaxis protein